VIRVPSSFLFGVICASALGLTVAGVSTSAPTVRNVFRPAPHATSIVGSSTGSLLYVQNNDTTPGYGTYGILSIVAGGPQAIGVIGAGGNPANSGNIGVLGYDVAPGGFAAAGYDAYPTQGTTTSANVTNGFFGIAPNGNGVMGETSVFQFDGTTKVAGVKGLDLNTNPYGVNDGVLGTVGNGGWGVEGDSGDNSNGGVAGYGTNKIGTYGQSNSYPGIWGASTSSYGSYSTSSTYVGSFGFSTSYVGVYGRSNGSVGVYGVNSVATPSANETPGVGVEGFSNGSAGVLGVNPTGDATPGAGYGVEGSSNGSDGVHGYGGPNSSGVGGEAFFGTWGRGIGYGAVGITLNGTGSNGVFGASYSATNGVGTYGEADATTGIGVLGVNDNACSSGCHTNVIPASGVAGVGYIGLVGQAFNATSYPFLALDNLGNDIAFIDVAGNFYYHGGLNHFVKTRSGSVGRTYAAASTMRTIEDFGSGALVGGAGTVRLEPAFADTIDGNSGYQVFLTPQGDCNGLYIAQKTGSAFVVRELHGGHSSIAFDYRIVAKENGHAAERVAVARSAAELGEPQHGSGMSSEVMHAKILATRARFETYAANFDRGRSASLANGHPSLRLVPAVVLKPGAKQQRAYAGPPRAPAMPAALLNFAHNH